MRIRMELAAAFLGGAAAKIYDDIVDTNIEVSGRLKESLKGFQWMALAVLSVNDFNFAAFIYIVNAFTYIINNDAFSGDYEFSLLLVFPLIFLINYNTGVQPSLMYAIVLLHAVIFFTIEVFITVENVSFKKCITRTISVLYICIIFLLNDYLNMPQSLLKLIVYTFGYLLLSSAFQGYMLYIHEEPKGREEAPKIAV